MELKRRIIPFLVKMKSLYLVYNSHLEEYFFSESSNPYSDDKRKVLLREEVIPSLKSGVNSKRKSLLNLVEIDKDLEDELRRMYKNSKIIIQSRTK